VRLSLLLGPLAATLGSALSAQSPAAIIDGFLTRHLAEIPVPGFSAVVVKDGVVLFQKGYGVEVVGRAKPMTVRSPIAIGSQTKSLTAIAIMRLVEAGTVDLDAPVTRYLPWFRTADQRGAEITVRMLLHNTSGLPSADHGLYSQDTDEGAIEREVRGLSAVPLVRAPGASFEYANENWTVAGAIIAAVSGMPYSRFLDREVLAPLGMTRSTTALARFPEIGALWGHHPEPDGVTPAGPRFLASAIPAGSELRASAEDMGRFLAMLLRKGATPTGRFLSEQSIATLFAPGSVTTVSMPDLGLLSGSTGYGMGWVINEAEGRTLIHHGGDAIVMGSWTAIDTASRTAASVLYGGPNLDPYRYPTRIWVVNNLLRLANGEPPSDFGRPKEADPTSNRFELPPDRLDRYQGTYLSSEGHRLVIGPGARGTRLELAMNAGPIRYRYQLDFASEASAVLRNITGSAVISFLITPGGQVTGIAGGLPGGTFRRRSAEELARVREAAAPDGSVRFPLPRAWSVHRRSGRLIGQSPADSATFVEVLTGLGPPPRPAGSVERLETIGRSQWTRLTWAEGIGENARQRVALTATIAGQPVTVLAATRAGRLTALLREVVVPLVEGIEVAPATNLLGTTRR